MKILAEDIRETKKLTKEVAELVPSSPFAATYSQKKAILNQIDFGEYPLKDGQLMPSSEPGFGMRLL